MNYTDILHFPAWSALGFSVLQTAFLFCFILLAIRMASRRIFAERGPQDFITIVLVAEACNQGLTHQDAGFWGACASVLTIFTLGSLVDRIGFLRRFLQEEPLVLYSNGQLHRPAMRKHMVDEDDLQELSRTRGFPHYSDFEKIILEGDGTISGIEKSKTVRPDAHQAATPHDRKTVAE